MERVRIIDPQPPARAAPQRMTFTELGVARLTAPTTGQVTYWDTGRNGQLGFSLLVPAGGTKTDRSAYYHYGQAACRNLGRVGEMDLVEARRLTLEDRRRAAAGTEPR